MKKLLSAIAVCATIAGCYYDKENLVSNCVVDPAAVRYSSTVSGLMNAYGCTGCHVGAVPSGGVELSTYAGVKRVASNGKLYGAITHASGFNPMPQGGAKMNDCDIRKVKAWIDAGAPNN